MSKVSKKLAHTQFGKKKKQFGKKREQKPNLFTETLHDFFGSRFALGTLPFLLRPAPYKAERRTSSTLGTEAYFGHIIRL